MSATAWFLAMAVLAAPPGFELRVVSSRPDAVSGGDALVRLSAPAGSAWTAALDGRDVSDAFKPVDGSTDRIALLSGLALGVSRLTVSAAGRVVATVELRNHPVAGPIFSGPHQTPFVCQTEANGLGPPSDADCSAKTAVSYYYKSTRAGEAADTARGLTPGFKPYDPARPPADVARVTTSDGRAVDYIVRREVGVINRAVYDIQILHRPGDPLPDPWRRGAGGWNRRLAYQFMVGCATGYRQAVLADPIGSVQEPLLSQGYAIATSTLNAFMNDCNDRISAETLSMVKEHFVEEFGEPVHTIGWGGSGGAMQVQLIAQNYPGLLDGIIPMASFPDAATFVYFTTDCTLLTRAFTASRLGWTPEQKAAVYGFPSWRLCETIAGAKSLRLTDPRNCDDVVPKALIYDAVTNPRGARCDLYGDAVNVFGRDPRTGFARRPLDNTGVQYGLTAFNRGVIDGERFVALNEAVGGVDLEGAPVAARMAADPESIRLAYERGLVLTGGGGLGDVPILDWRAYTDDLGAVDGHHRYLSFVTRARLVAANGNADNQVMIVDPREAWFDWKTHYWSPIGSLIRRMDRWLDAIAADRAGGSAAAKVVRNRPRDLEEGCVAPSGERIVERATYAGPGRCNRLYPSYGNPRIAAGGPVADDVLKCALKPIRARDYARPLSPTQLERLRAVFPAGVCDYGRPGIGQRVTKATWLRF